MQLPNDLRTALDQRVFVHLATAMPDGSPQVSAIWIGRRDDTLLFSTAEGRVKTENIRRDPRVALSFTTVDDDYRNWVLKGRVTRFEPDGWWLIDELSQKYHGRDYPRPAGQVRVNGEIEVDSFTANR